MSETDALKALNDLKDSLSVEFWDWAAYVSLFAVFIGVMGETIAELTHLVKDEVRKQKLAKASALILIAGLGGDIITFAKDRANTGIITDFLNKEAGDAYRLGHEARERATNLDADLTRQKKTILDQAQRIIDLEIEFGVRVPKAETDIGSLQSDREKIAARLTALGPRTVNENQRARIARALTGKKRLIVLVTVNDAEAQTYAKSIGEALTKAKFNVVAVALPTFPDTGVIVCQKNELDLRVFRVLEAVQIATEIKRLGKTSWPTYCEANRTNDATILQLGLISITIPAEQVWETGTRIFVGGRVPPS
jgi:hypothetical protein